MNVDDDDSLLGRTVRILGAFKQPAAALSVSEISRRTAIPMASTHRLVSRMLNLGLLEMADRHLVRVGVKVWELGWRSSSAHVLREIARPHMATLHDVVKQHTQLCVLDGSDVLYIDRMSATGPTAANITSIAGRLPAHSCSSGLVLLAHSAPHIVDAALAGPLCRLTPLTETDPDKLRQILARVRADGYAFVSRTVHAEAAGIAAPITRADGATVAALSVIIPDDPKVVRSATDLVIRSAQHISNALSALPARFQIGNDHGRDEQAAPEWVAS